MRATEELPIDLDPMSDHFALAMLANRSHRLNRALETVEGMPCSSRLDYECLVVFIAANFALRHRTSSRLCLPPLWDERAAVDQITNFAVAIPNLF
jgi:hypothetical protein